MKKPASHKATPFEFTSKAFSEVDRSETNTRLRRTVGDRFRRAREIEGLDQTTAAQRLGYKNSTQLSLAENGERLPPIEVFIRAVEVYGVSLDFLAGLSDEPERDPRMAERLAMRRQVHGILQSTSEVVVTQMSLYMSRQAPSLQTSRDLASKAREVTEAIAVLISRNNEAWQDMVHGARVERLSDELSTVAMGAIAAIQRYERLQQEVMNNTARRLGVESMPLFPEVGETQALVG
jgi:transcriptional regulator with XRE-family HTH domain